MDAVKDGAERWWAPWEQGVWWGVWFVYILAVLIHLPAVLKHLLAILDDVMEHDFKVFTMNLQGILIFWVHIYTYIICTWYTWKNRSSTKQPFLHEKNRSFTNIHMNIHTSLKINRSTPKYVLIFEICGNFHVSTLTGMYCWIPVLLQSYWYCFVSTFATDIFHAQLYHQCIIPSFVGPIKC